MTAPEQPTRGWDEAARIACVRNAFRAAGGLLAEPCANDATGLPPVPPGHARVISTDAVSEGHDFARGLGPLESAGHRAVCQNLSDLAACGARPVGFTWSLDVPDTWTPADLAAFAAGAGALSGRHGLPLLNGDIGATRGAFRASLTVLGDVAGSPLARHTARAGDLICVSGALGGSAAGLAEGLAALARGEEPAGTRALAKHLWPAPALTLGQALVGVATAAMDVSDGLGLDLHRLLDASDLGCTLDTWHRAIDPVNRGLAADTRRARTLAGGEDARLLFTLPSADAASALRRAGFDVRILGRTTPRGPRMAGGARLPRSGWDPF